jgi:hypothetical protein
MTLSGAGWLAWLVLGYELSPYRLGTYFFFDVYMIELVIIYLLLKSSSSKFVLKKASEIKDHFSTRSYGTWLFFYRDMS